MNRFVALMGFVAIASGASAAPAEQACYNRQQFSAPLIFKASKRAAQLKYLDAVCNLRPIPYRPNSPKYQGWVRYGTDNRNCVALGRRMFGNSTWYGSERRAIGVYWISVSREVQAGREGFVQLGYQNDADPGAGPEAKTFLRCFAPR